MTPAQAIQTKTKTASDLLRYQLFNRSTTQLKSLNLILKFIVPKQYHLIFFSYK